MAGRIIWKGEREWTSSKKPNPVQSQALVSVFNNVGVDLVERNTGYQE
jgi:hypothetical protein